MMTPEEEDETTTIKKEEGREIDDENFIFSILLGKNRLVYLKPSWYILKLVGIFVNLLVYLYSYWYICNTIGIFCKRCSTFVKNVGIFFLK